MSTTQLVGAAGLGLIAANAWTTQRPEFASIFTGDGDLAAAHTAAKQVGVELVAVAALVIVASTSDGAATACLCVLACLWLVWLMRRGHGTKVAAGGRPVTAPPSAKWFG